MILFVVFDCNWNGIYICMGIVLYVILSVFEMMLVYVYMYVLYLFVVLLFFF